MGTPVRVGGSWVNAVLLGKQHRVGAIQTANGFLVSARRRAGEYPVAAHRSEVTMTK